MVLIQALSGSLEDVQEAINTALAQGAEGIEIPIGDFLFDADGNRRISFNVPVAGFKIKGQGILPLTCILHLAPAISSTSPQTAMITAIGTSGGKLEFTGITLRGRGESNVAIGAGDIGLVVVSCRDFRVHHSRFDGKLGRDGIQAVALSWMGGDEDFGCRGVIDHCDFDDIFVQRAFDRNTGWQYGVYVAWYADFQPARWVDDVWSLAGKYDELPFIIYIEDCTFSDIRHAVVTEHAGVFVFRHNKVLDITDYMTSGSVDHHPYRDYGDGCRWGEVYDNELNGEGLWIGSGGGLWFRNTIDSRAHAYFLQQGETSSPNTYPRCAVKDLYIWDNIIIDAPGGVYYINNAGRIAPVKYERAPSASQGEIDYEPYPYPHPLTLGEAPAPPIASFTRTPVSPKTAEVVTFDASASHAQESGASIIDYSWDFGDGVADTGVTVIHAYTAAGDYSVKLTVTDSNYLTDEETQIIHVVTQGAGETIKKDIITDGYPGWTTSARAISIVRYDGKTTIAYFDYNKIPKCVQILSNGSVYGPIVVDSSPALDDHGYPVLAVDSEGYLHLVYDGHFTPLRYHRSSIKNDITGWQPVETIGGRCTYPQLVIDRNDTIYLLYREASIEGGTDNCWDIHIVRRPKGGTWSAPTQIIHIAEADRTTVCPYLDKMALGHEAGQQSLHILWHWYYYNPDYPLGAHGEARDACYAVSRDGGITWEKADETVYDVPINVDNAEYIYSGQISPLDTAHTYHGSVTVDYDNKVHLIYHTADASWSDEKLWYAHWDGTIWEVRQIGALLAAQMVSDGNNNLHAYGMMRNPSGPAWWEIGKCVSVDGGETWVQSRVTYDSVEECFYPEVKRVTSEGLLEVIYHERKGTPGHSLHHISMPAVAPPDEVTPPPPIPLNLKSVLVTMGLVTSSGAGVYIATRKEKS